MVGWNEDYVLSYGVAMVNVARAFPGPMTLWFAFDLDARLSPGCRPAPHASLDLLRDATESSSFSFYSS